MDPDLVLVTVVGKEGAPAYLGRRVGEVDVRIPSVSVEQVVVIVNEFLRGRGIVYGILIGEEGESVSTGLMTECGSEELAVIPLG